jgi:hypothetical protein
LCLDLPIAILIESFGGKTTKLSLPKGMGSIGCKQIFNKHKPSILDGQTIFILPKKCEHLKSEQHLTLGQNG